MTFFKSMTEISAEMVEDFKDITGITLDPEDLSREEVIKIRHVALAISHFRSDLELAHDGIWPGSSGADDLEKHLAARELPIRRVAQAAVGSITHTGTEGTVIPVGFQVRRVLDGALYQSREEATVPVGLTVDVAYEALEAGQASNVDVLEDDFEAVSPLAGLDSDCVNASTFADGRDLETPTEMLTRIEEHDLREDTGGNLVAYERLAKEASALVVGAHAISKPRGDGTVNTVITSGTTDIETAVNNGDAVERIPSDELVTIVQAYIIANNPTTDDHQTIKPTETEFDITVSYSLYDETIRAAVDAEIEKVVAIFLYSALSGDTIYPTNLERQIDARVGHLIKARRVADFDDPDSEYTIANGALLKPGTVTLETI